MDNNRLEAIAIELEVFYHNHSKEETLRKYNSLSDEERRYIDDRMDYNWIPKVCRLRC